MTKLIEVPTAQSGLALPEGGTELAKLPGCPKLTEALAAARDRCKAAAKGGYNEHHKYHYATADAVIDAASEAMAQSGLAIIPLREELSVKGNAQLAYYALDRVMILSHSSGEFVSLEVRGWPVVPDRGRPLDKAYAIALTSSLAYKLRDLLQMPRGTQDDLAAQDDRQTPAAASAVSAAPTNGEPVPNAPAPAAAQQPAQTISEQQQTALGAIWREKGRTAQDMQTLLASLGAPALAKILAKDYELASRLLIDGQVSTAQIDRIAMALRARKADPAQVSQWLQAKYQAPRLRLLAVAQADELERSLAAQPASA